MFQQIMSILKKDDLVNQAFINFGEMMDKTHQIYVESISSLFEKRDAEFDIYVIDRAINKHEKQIRRKVLEHLSVNAKEDVVASLVLTSVIIDVERIGDYCKNVYELYSRCFGKKPVSIQKSLRDDANKIAKLLPEAKEIFLEGDEDKALKMMGKLNLIQKRCDEHIYDLASESDVSFRKGITNVLFARYLKRIAAHLENVVSSVANPFDLIGFQQ